MNTLKLSLIGSTAIALVLAFSPATAQVKTPDASGGVQVQTQGGAQGGASAQGGAGAQGGVQMNKGGTQGGANVQGGADVQGGAQSNKGGTSAQGGVKAQGQGDVQTGNKGPASGKAQGQAKTKTDGSGQAQTKTQGETSSGSTAQTKSNSDAQSSSSATVTTEQKTEIKQYFSQNKPRVKSVERTRVNVSIGVAVPTFVALHPLPSTIIIARGDCPYHYFVWGNDIVIVESCHRHVVEIIVGVA